MAELVRKRGQLYESLLMTGSVQLPAIDSRNGQTMPDIQRPKVMTRSVHQTLIMRRGFAAFLVQVPTPKVSGGIGLTSEPISSRGSCRNSTTWPERWRNETEGRERERRKKKLELENIILKVCSLGSDKTCLTTSPC